MLPLSTCGSHSGSALSGRCPLPTTTPSMGWSACTSCTGSFRRLAGAGGRQQALPKPSHGLGELWTTDDQEGRRSGGELFGVPGRIARAADEAAVIVVDLRQLAERPRQA